jgi:uncharacterized small protein (DUF1192 family)
MDEDAPQTPKSAIIPGEDLSRFSIEDLEERRETLTAEIARIDAETEKKRTGLAAADAIFKL